MSVNPQFPGYARVGSPTYPAHPVVTDQSVVTGFPVVQRSKIVQTYGWADNYAVKFDGATSYADTSIVDFPATAASLSAWIKINSALALGTRYNLIGPSAGLNNWMNFTKLEGTNNLSLRGATVVAGAFSITASGAPSVGQWYHMLLTFNGTDIKGYIDGTLIGTVNRPGASLVVPATNLRIARSSAVYAPITVRQVSVWNRAVSVSEVASGNLPINLTPPNAYGVPVVPSGLINWWQAGNGYKWNTYRLANSVGANPFTWTNGVQTTQVVAV